MGLKWFLNSAFTQVLGHKKEGHENINDFEHVKEEPFHYEVTMEKSLSGFQMPLHYPRYTKEDYEKMEEVKLDLLLKEYGLCFHGTLEEKRAFAMGAFLWPDQY